jgi:hypothetical protein
MRMITSPHRLRRKRCLLPKLCSNCAETTISDADRRHLLRPATRCNLLKPANLPPVPIASLAARSCQTQAQGAQAPSRACSSSRCFCACTCPRRSASQTSQWPTAVGW